MSCIYYDVAVDGPSAPLTVTESLCLDQLTALQQSPKFILIHDRVDVLQKKHLLSPRTSCQEKRVIIMSVFKFS